MSQQIFGSGSERSILNQVREGMRVYDRDGDAIGSVDFVHFGESTLAETITGSGPAEVTEGVDDSIGEGTFVDVVADIFRDRDDEINETVRDRLLQSGFVRVDVSGLFAGERFLTPDQIAGVSQDGLHLRVSKDQLIDID